MLFPMRRTSKASLPNIDQVAKEVSPKQHLMQERENNFLKKENENEFCIWWIFFENWHADACHKNKIHQQ